MLGKLFGKIATVKIVGKIFVGENVWKISLGKNVCNIRCRKYGAIVSCPVHFPANLSRNARYQKPLNASELLSHAFRKA